MKIETPKVPEISLHDIFLKQMSMAMGMSVEDIKKLFDV